MKDDMPPWMAEEPPPWEDVPAGADEDIDDVVDPPVPPSVPPPRPENAAEVDDEKPDGGVWGILLKTTRRGKDGEIVEGGPKANGANVAMILRYDPRWSGKVAWDEHQACQIYGDDLLGRFRPLRDSDATHIQHWLSRVYSIDVPQPTVDRALAMVAEEHTTHPLREWLSSLQWDGVDRLAELWTRYFGVDDHPLVADYGTMWAIQAVARVMRPGCDAQGMVVLVGAQGRGKSRGVAALAGRIASERPEGRPLSVDLPSGMPLGHKDVVACMHGAWIVNADELEGLSRSGIAEVKAWITRTEDTYRAPYAARPATHQRQQVLIGSTNLGSFLADSSGSRRFWVMDLVRNVDVDAIQRDREQLWAEAVALYRSGVRWWLTHDQQAIQRGVNDGYRVDGYHEPQVSAYLSAQQAIGATAIFPTEVVAWLERDRPLGVDQQKAIAKVRATLEHLGCSWSMRHKRRCPSTGVPARYYVPPWVDVGPEEG